MSEQVVSDARTVALRRYSHANVRDRYDADLLIAGFEDGAAWQATVAERQLHADELLAWVDYCLALPLYENVSSEFGKGVAETFEAVRKVLVRGLGADARAALVGRTEGGAR